MQLAVSISAVSHKILECLQGVCCSVEASVPQIHVGHVPQEGQIKSFCVWDAAGDQTKGICDSSPETGKDQEQPYCNLTINLLNKQRDLPRHTKTEGNGLARPA